MWWGFVLHRMNLADIFSQTASLAAGVTSWGLRLTTRRLCQSVLNSGVAQKWEKDTFGAVMGGEGCRCREVISDGVVWWIQPGNGAAVTTVFVPGLTSAHLLFFLLNVTRQSQNLKTPLSCPYQWLHAFLFRLRESLAIQVPANELFL